MRPPLTVSVADFIFRPRTSAAGDGGERAVGCKPHSRSTSNLGEECS